MLFQVWVDTFNTHVEQRCGDVLWRPNCEPEKDLLTKVETYYNINVVITSVTRHLTSTRRKPVLPYLCLSVTVIQTFMFSFSGEYRCKIYAWDKSIHGPSSCIQSNIWVAAYFVTLFCSLYDMSYHVCWWDYNKQFWILSTAYTVLCS